MDTGSVESATQSVTSAIVTISEMGYIQSVDRRTCTLFGYTPDELQGKKINVLIPPPYREQHDTYLENYKETGIKKIIGRNRLVEGLHKDGSIFPIRLSVTEVKVVGIRMFIGAMEKVPDKSMILVSDERGNIMSCTRACEELLGYTAVELVGRSINVLMPSPHSQLHNQYIQDNYHSGGMLRMLGHVRNLPIRHKNGLVFPVSIQVNKTTTGGVVAFRASIERPPSETVFTIDQEGNIVSCNYTFVRPMFGYTHDYLIGKNICTLIPDLDLRDQGGDNKKRKAVSGTRVADWVSRTTKTVQVRHQDGSEFPVKMELTVLRPDERGHVLYSLKIESVTNEDVNITTENGTNGQEAHDSSTGLQPELIGDYALTKFLGRGNYGMVKMGVHKATQARVAVKILLKDHLDPVGLQRVMREIKILQQLDHPNIAKLYDVIEKPDALFLIMEYCGGGDLLGYLRKHHISHGHTPHAVSSPDLVESGAHLMSHSASSTFGSSGTAGTVTDNSSNHSSGSSNSHTSRSLSKNRLTRGDSLENLRDSKLGNPLSEEDTRPVFKQIASAIYYCHSLNIIHRDIKHKNILFDEQGHVKLIDFGLSNWACGGTMSFCGTPAYASPEMLLGTQYTGPEVDVWSLGILLFSLVTGKLPFVNVIDIIRQNYSLPESLSPECADLIKKCLVLELTKRATLNDIISHPWMHNLPLSTLPQPQPFSLPTTNIAPTTLSALASLPAFSAPSPSAPSLIFPGALTSEEALKAAAQVSSMSKHLLRNSSSSSSVSVNSLSPNDSGPFTRSLSTPPLANIVPLSPSFVDSVREMTAHSDDEKATNTNTTNHADNTNNSNTTTITTDNNSNNNSNSSNDDSGTQRKRQVLMNP